MKQFILVLICSLVPSLMYAAPSPTDNIPFESCFDAADRRFGVGKALLVAIAYQETSMNPDTPDTFNRDRDRTYDIGLMRINSWWLKHEWFAAMGLTEDDLRKPCTNIYFAAFLLSKKQEKYGYWNGVGYYNAWSKDKREIYVEKIKVRLAWVRKNVLKTEV